MNRKPATARVTDRNEISDPDYPLFKYGGPPSVESEALRSVMDSPGFRYTASKNPFNPGAVRRFVS